MLGAIESLLSAVIADGMTDTQARSRTRSSSRSASATSSRRSSAASPRPARSRARRPTSAPARGRRSPRSRTRWSCWSRCSLLAPLVAYVPMASLAALLLSSPGTCRSCTTSSRIVRVAPKSDVFVLLTCFLLTVFFDMVVAVSVGFVLAALLFMRRMSELTESRLHPGRIAGGGSHERPRRASLLYEINGPLFFGAAQNAMRALGLRAATRSRCSSSTSAASRSSTRPASSRSRTRSRARSRRESDVILAGPLPKPQRDLRQGEAGEETRRAAHRQGRRRGGRTRRAAARRSQDTALRSRRAPGGSRKEMTSRMRVWKLH